VSIALGQLWIRVAYEEKESEGVGRLDEDPKNPHFSLLSGRMNFTERDDARIPSLSVFCARLLKVAIARV